MGPDREAGEKDSTGRSALLLSAVILLVLVPCPPAIFFPSAEILTWLQLIAKLPFQPRFHLCVSHLPLSPISLPSFSLSHPPSLLLSPVCTLSSLSPSLCTGVHASLDVLAQEQITLVPCLCNALRNRVVIHGQGSQTS